MDVDSLGQLPGVLDPDSLVWLAVAEARRRQLLRRVHTLPLAVQWMILGDPRSVLDLRA